MIRSAIISKSKGHYGFLSSKRKTEALAFARKSLRAKTPEKKLRSWQQICIEKLGFDPEACPCCKKGRMLMLQEIKPGREPPDLDLLRKRSA